MGLSEQEYIHTEHLKNISRSAYAWSFVRKLVFFANVSRALYMLQVVIHLDSCFSYARFDIADKSCNPL